MTPPARLVWRGSPMSERWTRATLRERLAGPEYDEVRARTYLALDVPDAEQARAWIDRLGDAVDGYKVGLELFYASGTQLLDELARRHKRVFLDVKLHDIPNTVAGAAKSLCQHPLEMVNVHAAAGRRALTAAREAVEQSAFRPLLIGVTVLTSLDADDLADIGMGREPQEWVVRLAQLVKECGLDGVVASAREVQRLRSRFGSGFELVIPGTRPSFAERADQRRTLTPGEALRLGATRLVLGRAVTRAEEPELALFNIWEEMRQALDHARNGGGER